MMHGPCGPDHRSCPCMVENKCSKKFPKTFNDETFLDENGYGIYKRSDNGRTIKNKAHTFIMDIGSQEWKDFREFEGVVYRTCKEACYARSLLEDDKEYIKGLIEASEWGMGDYLPNYFVKLILLDSMSRPEIVWEKMWKLLAEDVLELERQKWNHPGI
nr:ATP-dependent DNA helicase PIF1-like [Tanacetum cinerariifolium]